MDEIKEQLDQVQKNILKACGRAGRSPEEVNVIAVTKYVDVETTRRVLDAGLTDIGESRAQEAIPKWEMLGDRGVWHFIGHLQRNKVKAVVGRFTYVHSLDRYSLAWELNKRSEALEQPTRCFIQVNVAGEESKHGLKPEEVIDFVRERRLPWLRSGD